jgi:hypothetical protein
MIIAFVNARGKSNFELSKEPQDNFGLFCFGAGQAQDMQSVNQGKTYIL